ncbi:MAG: hypothetical protein SPJ27_09270 [Candidatus Onthovivens sp.]|nr:hypothetical protein [Candidatus Onthovivens sp.]
MYQALISFSGLISMTKGEIRKLSNPDLIQDLLKANFIEEYKINESKTEIKEKKHRKKD